MVDNSKVIRDRTAQVEKHWSDFSVHKTGSSHLCFTLRLRGLHRRVFTSLTPSDRRTGKNFEREVLKQIKQLREDANAHPIQE
nr:hypothetical protein [uncultured Cohaesibacter sp.]